VKDRVPPDLQPHRLDAKESNQVMAVNRAIRCVRTQQGRSQKGIVVTQLEWLLDEPF